MNGEILLTLCARGGSKGVPAKNIRPLMGKPLIAHSIELAKKWGKASKIVVSTDSQEIAEVARRAGAEVPFMRPAELATDTATKMGALTHALRESEKIFGRKFSTIVDLDPTAPIRECADLDRGLERLQSRGADCCFSVTKAHKNPYFNMVERQKDGFVGLVKQPAGGSLAVTGRQGAPEVWDMNSSIYLFTREFLLREPPNLWAGKCEVFEMDGVTAFDIDFERDFVVVEALMKWKGSQNG